MGFVLLGIATMTATGFTAALIGNIAHGIITGLLFFLAGAVKHRTHTGRLARSRRPAGAGAGTGRRARVRRDRVARAARTGRFLGRGVRGGRVAGPQPRRLWTVLGVLAAVGGVLTAAYFLRMLRRVTHGRRARCCRGDRSRAVGRVELVTWAPLVALALVVGLVPASVLAMAQPSRSRARWAVGGGAGERPRIDQVALLPAYAAAGTALLAFLIDLFVPGPPWRRSWRSPRSVRPVPPRCRLDRRGRAYRGGRSAYREGCSLVADRSGCADRGRCSRC